MGCGQDEIAGTAAPPKPVTVMTLRSGIPRSETLVAGVVEPYRRSDVSFDVAGLVTDVVDLGEPADGPQFDGKGALLLDREGRPVREGTVLAVMDPTRFRQAVTAAELSLASTDRQIDALEVELSTVFPARVESARATASAASADVASARQSVTAEEAELELARTTVERDRVLIQSGAVAQSVLDQSESGFRTATASLAQARAALDAALQSEQSAIASRAETEGNFRVRQADLVSLQASRAELVNALEQARTDLASSVLRAPFQGRVTARHVERGAYANAGTPILELTMESAVKVVITVSAREERELAIGMRMPIYTDGTAARNQPDEFAGVVFEKASVADSGTRTFRIGLILPNPLLDSEANGVESTSIADLFPVVRLPGTPRDHLYINVSCLLQRDGETFVLALRGGLDRSARSGARQVPQRVPIRLTDAWAQLDTWSLRRIEVTPELGVGDMLILDPNEADEAGIAVGGRQFAFRPGDVVRVGLTAGLPQPGFWVPATAIVPRSGDSLLFVVRDGVAREISVDLQESSGAYRRVTAPELGDGDAVVVRGMQYVEDGDAVTRQPAASEGGR
ncbi:MAG: HlyD family efflux transporter periplasmic adaptor subunit [Planctomycetota bacterium]